MEKAGTRPTWTAEQGGATLRSVDQDRARRKGSSSSGLTPAMIEALKRRGYSQSDIARMFGISRQRVSQIKHQWDRYSRTPREIARDLFPFKVPKAYQDQYPDKMLRHHGEYMMTGGEGMDRLWLNRLGHFYDRLRKRHEVISFNLSNPPSEGVSYGGYKYEPRTEADGDFIVRFNDDTDLSDEDKLVWRFPPVNPLETKE